MTSAPLPRSPYIGAYIEFPAPITAVFRFNRDVAVVMDKLLWFYSPFSSHRQLTAGVIHHEYLHPNTIICVCTVSLPGSYSTAIAGASDPTEAVDFDLLLFDSVSAFTVVNLSRSVVCATFEAPHIAAGGVLELRGSPDTLGEFAVRTASAVFICQMDLSRDRRGPQIVHRHRIEASSIREFGGGYLALHNHNLLFIKGEERTEFLPDKPVSRFATDAGNVVAYSQVSPKSEAEVIVVSGPSFRVGHLVAFDAYDEYVVVLLKGWVLLVVNREDVNMRMHIQVGATNVTGFDKRATIVCGKMEDAQLFAVLFFCNENMMAVQVPQNLFPDTDECVEEDEEELQ
jgi:hypothetical protein